MKSSINDAAHTYWNLTRYTDEQLDAFCQAHDGRFMIAKVTFNKSADVKVSISTKTWDRQEGHYGTIVSFFSFIASSDGGRDLDGSIIVWLEDGAFDYTRDRTRVIPLMAFGRSIDDTQTFLIPDPSYLATHGYVEDLKELVELDTTPFEKKGRSVFWRGAATGTGIDDETLWRSCARGVLALKSKELANSSVLDAKITKIDHLSKEQQENLRGQGVIGEYLEFAKFLQHAYLVDADGFHCAWRSLFLKLATKSVTVKINSNLEQWYFRELKPWYHYVPMMSDISDVVDIHRWLEAHPDECKEIIQNANHFISSLTFDKEIRNVTQLCKEMLSYRRL